MQYWVIKSPKKISLVNEESSDFNPKTHAKVKVARAPICQSDLSTYEAKFENLPIVPSRCGVGLISESKDPAFSMGLRVYISPYVENKNALSIYGKDVDGLLSDFIVVPNKNIHILPENISDEAFSFVEDVALCLKTFKILKFKETQYIVFYGATTLNIILAQIAIYYQAIPIIIDTDSNALSIAENNGIYYCINSKNETVKTKLVEITAGKMADVLIIDSDFNSTFDIDFLKNVGENGKVAFIGYNSAVEQNMVDISYVISKHLSIYGISDGIGEIEQAINMLTTKIIKVEDLVEKVCEFEEVPEVFSNAIQQKNRFKTLIRC